VRCVKNREPGAIFHGNRQRAQYRKYWDDFVNIEEKLAVVSTMENLIIDFEGYQQKIQHFESQKL